MDSTTVEGLLVQGYTEDPEGIKGLERSYKKPIIIGVGGFGLSFVLMMFGKVSDKVGLGLAVISWLFIINAIIFMYRSQPRSRHTGKVLLKYKNRNLGPSVMLEVIYVCPESKTFFRRIYAESGDG